MAVQWAVRLNLLDLAASPKHRSINDQQRTAPSKNQAIAICGKCTLENMKVKEEKSLHSDTLRINYIGYQHPMT